MSKSIAELTAESIRPSTPFKATVGQGRQYVAEIKQLTEQLDELDTEQARLNAEREDVLAQAAEAPRPMGQTMSPERVVEIDARLAEIETELATIHGRLSELLSLIADYEGTFTITATASDGEWAQWRVEHPARGEGEPGYREDLTVAAGWCNSDALIEDLARYVTAWNDEPLAEGNFDALGVMRPDKKQMARLVVGLYETGDGLGELRRGLSAHLMSVTDSPSPAA